MIDLIERVEMMTRNIIAAGMHHDLWSAHIRDTAWKQTAVYREELSDLWWANSLAHRYTFYVRAASAYIEHRKANSIPALVRECRDRMSPEQLVEVDQLLAEAIPVFNKIEELRNNVYAHLSKARNVKDVYGDVEINLDEAARLISLSIDIVNIIRASAGLGAADIGRSHIDQFFSAMNAIDGIRQSGPLSFIEWPHKAV